MKYDSFYQRRDHQWDTLKGTAEAAASDPVRNAIYRVHVVGRTVTHKPRKRS